MTEELGKSNNQPHSAPEGPEDIDPRIVAMVQLLARRAAEADYARLLDNLSRSSDANRPEERI